MKKQKTEVAKTQKANFIFKSTGDDKKDVEFLKRKLQRQENQLKQKTLGFDFWFDNALKANSRLKLAYKEIKDLNEIIMGNLKLLNAQAEITNAQVEITKSSAELLCDMVQNNNSNLFPHENYEIIQELKHVIKLFSSLAHSEKNDLLTPEIIQAYLQQRN